MSARKIPVELISDEGETVVINGPELSKNLEIVLKGGDALSDQAPLMVIQGPSAAPLPGSPASDNRPATDRNPTTPAKPGE
ncbi:MAG: hypothetical protein HC805_03410 [Alkalinema sp. RL_2_19]|nr:hypothetical protein [Alkalinema sp. RL_2_19]